MSIRVYKCKVAILKLCAFVCIYACETNMAVRGPLVRVGSLLPLWLLWLKQMSGLAASAFPAC